MNKYSIKTSIKIFFIVFFTILILSSIFSKNLFAINSTIQKTYSLHSKIFKNILSDIKHHAKDDNDINHNDNHHSKGKKIFLIRLEDVIFTDKDMMFHYQSDAVNFIYHLIDKYKSSGRNIYRNMVKSWYLNRELMLVDDYWPKYISQLQNHDIMVIAVCSMPMYIYNIEKIVASKLIDLNLSFTDNINGKKVIMFNDNKFSRSLFYNGIIFTGKETIANSIINFMKNTMINIDSIYYADIDSSNLDQMKHLTNEYKINYYPILYLGVRDMPYFTKDMELGKAQVKYLYKHQIWLTEDQMKDSLQDSL